MKKWSDFSWELISWVPLTSSELNLSQLILQGLVQPDRPEDDPGLLPCGDAMTIQVSDNNMLSKIIKTGQFLCKQLSGKCLGWMCWCEWGGWWWVVCKFAVSKEKGHEMQEQQQNFVNSQGFLRHLSCVIKSHRPPSVVQPDELLSTAAGSFRSLCGGLILYSSEGLLCLNNWGVDKAVRGYFRLAMASLWMSSIVIAIFVKRFNSSGKFFKW